jgi:hypothetical protein
MHRAFARGGQSQATHFLAHSDPWLRSGLIAETPSPEWTQRLELPFSFEVAAA